MKEIRQIIQLYDRLKADDTSAALAVVVEVEQSSYRRVGARLLVASDGRYIGGISGGCLEGDALRRARTAILSDTPSFHIYDTLDGEDEVIGIGLGCNGRIKIMFLPLDFSDPSNEIERLRTVVHTREPVLLARLLEGKDDVPPPPSVYSTGDLAPLAEQLGVPTAALETEAARHLAGGRSKVARISDEQGQVRPVLFEIVQPEIHLVISGTNYDIPPTLRAARHLGWRTTVIGARRKFTREMETLADQLLDYSEAGTIRPDAATAIALMSHDYDWDRRMVEVFLPRQPRYLGMLGPRKRVESMAKELPGFDLLSFPNLYSPVGLDIGAESPEEIAASLVSEIIMVFRDRNGGPLRQRSGSIHT
ncbi:XdhC family protein [Neolewinella aurantiaca]|uniref:XdhC family protein n=1 Tax=Neolewinella aurantiaca TaxID=2602767 RepID=A0A5C7FEU4_9BACT|nr:XdhC family protein [Neolewinella aurantiaca]TXF88058.1 XdhC family protein [Neolewinella aurantiaca]